MRILATSEWRKEGNIFYPQDIRAAPSALPPPVALPSTVPELPPVTQVPPPPPKIPKEPSKASDPVQEAEASQDKNKGKGVKPLPEAKRPKVVLEPKDAVPKAKDATPKTKEANPKSKGADSKAIDPPPLSQAARISPLLPRPSLGFFPSPFFPCFSFYLLFLFLGLVI